MALEAASSLVGDAPELAAADGWGHSPTEDVAVQIDQTQGGKGLTDLAQPGESYLRGLLALLVVDSDWPAPALPWAQGIDAPLAEGVVDVFGELCRTGAVHQRALQRILAMEAREVWHRPVLGNRVLNPPRELEEAGRFLAIPLTNQRSGPAGHRHLLAPPGRVTVPAGVQSSDAHYDSRHEYALSEHISHDSGTLATQHVKEAHLQVHCGGVA